MSAYTPPTLTNGTLFDPQAVRDGFDGISTAINGTVDQVNLNKLALQYHRFHPGAATDTFETPKDQAPYVAIPVIFDKASYNPTWGGATNVYDIEGTGVDFYLHNPASLWFDGHCAIYRPKNSWITGSGHTINWKFNVELVLDGTVIRTAEYDSENITVGSQRRGWAGQVCDVRVAVAAGKHRAWIRVDARSSTISGVPAAPLLSEFYSPSRSLSILAAYI